MKSELWENMDKKMVLNKLKEIVDDGEREFVIYPFGNNGVMIRDLLADYFGIESKVIVDNGYAGYREGIINISDFSNVYNENMFVLFTIEDEEENLKVYKELIKIVPENRILNLLENIFIHRNRDIAGKYSLDYFLPEIKRPMPIVTTDSNRIRVRIVYQGYCEWNTIRTIMEACHKDSDIELLVIMAREELDIEKRIRQLQDLRYPFVLTSAYDVSIDRPDVLVFSHNHPLPEFNRCRMHTKMIVVASLGVIRYSHSNKMYSAALEEAFGVYKPDFYLFDSLVYRHMKSDAYFSDKNVVEMGNAKYDGIYEACRDKQYPEEWSKLKGKQVVLWTTDHGMIRRQTYMEAHEGTTFDLYAKHIFEYANKHTDIGVIFRPHVALIAEMLYYNFWTSRDIELLRTYCESTPNLIWDERETYDAAYAVADAILTDSQCGIICSALPTMKPICVLYRPGENIVSYEEELTKNYYSARSEGELSEFFEMIANGKDPMREQRKSASDKYVKNFDGKNGYRIKEFIKEEFRKKYFGDNS